MGEREREEAAVQMLSCNSTFEDVQFVGSSPYEIWEEREREMERESRERRERGRERRRAERQGER